jgi:hypothetical protein
MPLFSSCRAWFRLPRVRQSPLAFVHLYKTAGTSINVFLVNRFPAGECWRMYPEQGETYRDRLPSKAMGCYSGHLRYDEMMSVVPRGTKVFTIVRDPIERALSAYYGCRRQTREVLARRSLDYVPLLDLSLPEFARTHKQLAICLLGSFQTNQFGRAEELGRCEDGSFVPPTRKDLARARENLARCLVGTTERLGEFVGLLCKECGWPEPDRVPVENKNNQRPRDLELDKETRDFLEEHTALDVELHRFANELLQERLDRSCTAPPSARHPGRQWSFTFDQPIPGYGWHQRQPWRGGHFCFSEPRAWLDCGTLTGRQMRVEINTVTMLPPEHTSPLRLRVNGREVRLTSASTPDGTTYRGVLPWSLDAESTRVQLEAPSPVRPCDVVPNNNDSRLIGPAITAVRLTV